jgi:hypothetical protein
MKPFSIPDLRRMNSRELAALQNDVLRGVALAAEQRRRGEGELENIRRARAQRLTARQEG